MKQVKAEIVAVGTELLLGQIANTNAQWISQKLAMTGIDVHFHEVVGDNLTRVKDVFKQASKRSDIIIVTGGLGPTDDDMTREAFQAISKMELVEHTWTMEKIQAYFQRTGQEMTPNNRKQARVFKDAMVIKNEVGMAPGMIVPYEGKTWVFLPGVPREMKTIFEHHIIPFLLKTTGQNKVIQSTVLRFIGIGESQLEYAVQDLIKTQTNPTIAPLAQRDGVVLRLTAKEDTPERANQLIQKTAKQILSRVGSYYYGSDDETIEKKIVSLLKDKNIRIAAAESLTGGLFTEKIISVEGASAVCTGGIVCYDTEVKSNVLNVSTELIAKNGTVSKECAMEMAQNVRELLNANVGISFTGIAGPDSIEGKPVGTVYISICDDQGRNRTEKYMFQGKRDSIRYKAMLKGFELLLAFLK